MFGCTIDKTGIDEFAERGVECRSDGEAMAFPIALVELGDGFAGEGLDEDALGVGESAEPFVVQFGVDSNEVLAMVPSLMVHG